ncbi:MAG: cupin domain-containing protein [Phycisphaerales bacterium]
MVTAKNPLTEPGNGNAGHTLNVLGVPTQVLLTAHQTHGACSAFKITVPPGFVNPPHVHWFEDETFFVLSGELEVTVGSMPSTVHAGQAAFGPRRVIHGFANRSDSPAVAIVHAAPGGLERFVEACHAAFPEGVQVDPVALVSLIERHGMSVA